MRPNTMICIERLTAWRPLCRRRIWGMLSRVYTTSGFWNVCWLCFCGMLCVSPSPRFLLSFPNRSVNPEDVGGEEQYTAIKGEFNAMYQNALNGLQKSIGRTQSQVSLNQRCYCTHILERQRWDEAGGWFCNSCFKDQSGRILYQCFNGSCLFFQMSGGTEWFNVCPSCFESGTGHNQDTKTMNDGKNRI